MNKDVVHMDVVLLSLEKYYTEIIIVSAVSQTEKNKYHMAVFICEILKNDTNKLIYKTGNDSQT